MVRFTIVRTKVEAAKTRGRVSSGGNLSLDTLFRGRLSTLLGHSASHSERLFLPPKLPFPMACELAEFGPKTDDTLI